MKKHLIAYTLPAILLVIGIALMYAWMTDDATWDIVKRLPGQDGKPKNLAANKGPIKIEGKLENMEGKPSQLTGAWPGFRGAKFDAINTEEVKLARSWCKISVVVNSFELAERLSQPTTVRSNTRVVALVDRFAVVWR